MQVVMGMLRCQNLNIEIYVQLILFGAICITNIDLTNGVTVHWGCQEDSPGYSL